MTQVDFTMRAQRLREWCWAAVTVSVDAYFDKHSDWTECKMAAAELGLKCCDQAQQCNQVHRLDPALGRVGRLRGTPLERVLTFAEIQHEIDANRPVCLRVGWPNGGGHFLAIAGYGVTPSGIQKVLLVDSYYGTSHASYDALRTRYQGSGTWTHTFLLQS